MYIECPSKLHILLFGSVFLFTWRSLFRGSCLLCISAFRYFFLALVALFLHCFVLDCSLRGLSLFRSSLFMYFVNFLIGLVRCFLRNFTRSFVHVCSLSFFL